MIYNSVTMKGFGPHKNKTVELPATTIVITGGNGSGKTTVVDAIRWCLYGPKGLSRGGKDRTSVINDSSRSAEVTVTMTNEYGREFIVSRKLTRSGGHSMSLSIDGEQQEGTLTERGKTVESIMGVDSNIFSVLSVLSSSPSESVNQFITGTPSLRRSLLASMVDPMGHYAATNKAVKKQLRDRRKDVSSSEGKISVIQDLLDNRGKPRVMDIDIDALEKQRGGLTRSMGELSVDSSDFDVMDSLDKARADMSSLSGRQDMVNNNRRDIDDAIGQARRDISELNSQQNILEGKISRAESVARGKKILSAKEKDIKAYAVSASRWCLDVARKEASRIDSKASKAQTLRELATEAKNGSCPVCGGEYDPSHSSIAHSDSKKWEIRAHKQSEVVQQWEKLELYVSELEPSQESTYRDVANQYIEESRKLDYCMEKTRINIEPLEDKKQQLDATAKDIAQKIAHVTETIRKLENAATGDQSRDYRDISRKVEEINELIAAKKANVAEWDSYNEDMAENQRKLDTYQKEWKTRKAIVEQLERLAEQTSSNGIISEDIERFVGEVAESANLLYDKYLDKIDNIDIFTSSEDGDPTCVILADDRDLASYSHGEQMRVIVTVALSLLIVFYGKNGQWLPPMWDEPGLPIDDGVATDVMKMIAETTHTVDGQSIIITRNNEHVNIENIHVLNMDN